MLDNDGFTVVAAGKAKKKRKQQRAGLLARQIEPGELVNRTMEELLSNQDWVASCISACRCTS